MAETLAELREKYSSMKRKLKELEEIQSSKVAKLDEQEKIEKANNGVSSFTDENDISTDQNNRQTAEVLLRTRIDDDGSIPENLCDYTNPHVSLTDKLAMWSASHDISDEALNELLDILKSSDPLDTPSTSTMAKSQAMNAQSMNAQATKTQPKVNQVSTITEDNYYLSDSCSTMGYGVEIKKEFPEDMVSEVTLGTVMVKLNYLESMVCQTNSDVGYIKRALSRMENTLPVAEFNNDEDINDIIPDLKLPVQNIEELVKLDYFLSDVENCRKLVSF